MASRTIIRATGSIPAAVIATMVFGGLASLGLRVVVVAFEVGAVAPWVWALLAVCAALLWAVIHVLWGAFGVALVISAAGVWRPGPFGGRRLAAEGLRLGQYDTVRMRNVGGSGARGCAQVTEFWGLSPGRRAVLLLEVPRGAPEVARAVQAVGLHLGQTFEAMGARGQAGFGR